MIIISIMRPACCFSQLQHLIPIEITPIIHDLIFEVMVVFEATVFLHLKKVLCIFNVFIDSGNKLLKAIEFHFGPLEAQKK
mmetsp:Transcript_35317/g.61679  ORF Transcript_35317/g.61679 Transcript_35317/m.61679 type:complete len:81 (+) Transcript_35317:75-317(+)